MAKSWSVKNLYFYLVCLVTLFMIVGGFIAAATSAVEIILPNRPNIPLIHLYYPEMRGLSAEPEPVMQADAGYEPPSVDELKRIREEREKSDLYYTAWAKRRLLNALAFIIIPLPFYFYHWKQVKPGSGGK